MSDRPSPGCIIALAIALCIIVALSLCARRIGAGPIYQYAVCGADQLRSYDGADGYVRWGRWVFVDPPLGGWTDAALPNVGKARLLSLIGCRVQVRDSQGVLWLAWDGAWSLPAVGAELYLPEVRG